MSDTELERLNKDETQAWDSQTLVRIVTEIEAEFDLFLEVEEAMSIKSFQSCIALLSSKIP